MKVMRAITYVAVVGGALASAALVLFVGRHNGSKFLLLLFVGWTMAPYVGFVIADVALKRRALYSVMLLIVAVSLAIYGGVAFGPPAPKPAAYFLMTPLASLILMAITIIASKTPSDS